MNTAKHLRSLLLCAWAAAAVAAEPPRNPVVRVVTVGQEYLDRGNRDRLLEDTMERLDRAAAFRPDIAALPEVFLPGDPEVVPGPVTRRLAAWAERHSSYVLFGLRTKADGRMYNTAVLLDRRGQLVGQYHKAHPTEGELKDGVQPGDPEPPVFQTDFGLIGIQICFDVNWWESWKRLKQKGARLIFFPAAYPADRQLSALAVANQVFIASATNSRVSRIYDITGEVLSASGRFQQWVGAELPLGRRLFEVDFNTAKAQAAQKKYGSRIDLKWYHEDDWFTLASLDPNLTVEDLVAEFGLTPLNEYRERATKAVDEARRTR